MERRSIKYVEQSNSRMDETPAVVVGGATVVVITVPSELQFSKSCAVSDEKSVPFEHCPPETRCRKLELVRINQTKWQSHWIGSVHTIHSFIINLR